MGASELRLGSPSPRPTPHPELARGGLRLVITGSKEQAN